MVFTILDVGRRLLRFYILANDLSEFVAIGDIEFNARPVNVTFNGTNRYRQPLRDFPVRQSFGDKRSDLALAGGHRQRLAGGPDRRRYRSAALRGQP